MSQDIDRLYGELIQGITLERLQKISVEIINCYKSKNREKLAWFSGIIGLKADLSDLQRMFSALIQKYHPDKLTALRKEIDLAHSTGNYEKLSAVKKSFLFGEAPKIQPAPEPVEDELYEYGSDDFGYEEKVPEEDSPAEEDFPDEDDEEAHEVTFYEALNNVFLGNNEIEISESDLRNLDGDLDLSDAEISDLHGAEYCVYLTSLNLSANKIQSIEKLSNLTNLRALYIAGNKIEKITAVSLFRNLEELDISDNLIEDISALLSLENLVYCNILNNPVRDISVIRKLEERGIIVIY